MRKFRKIANFLLEVSLIPFCIMAKLLAVAKRVYMKVFKNVS